MAEPLPVLEQPPRRWVPVVLGIFTFGATWLITRFQDSLTTEGKAWLSASAALMIGSFTYLLFPKATRGVALILILLGAAGSGWSWTTFQKESPDGVAEMVGGCEPFVVYAQGRYDPLGAAKLATPVPEGKKIGGYEANERVAVDGWVRTRAAYPTNPEPFNSDIWFHLADDSGWVSFPGVRADPTSYDPTGFDPDGGRAAPTPEECSGTFTE